MIFDLICVALLLGAIIGGYRLGFVTRLLSWIGLACGLVVSIRLLPVLLERVQGLGHLVVLGSAVGLVIAGAILGQGIGFALARRLRPHEPDGNVTAPDRVMGVAAGVLGVLVVVWLLVPMLASTPGWSAREVSSSRVAREIDARFPAAPDAVQALRSLVGEDRYPDVFAALRPTPALGPPPGESGLGEAVTRSASQSVVKVEGIACRRIQDGTGFVVADDLVATNAHVVAGEASTSVQRDDGKELAGEVVAFDPDRDLAILRVDGLDRPAPARRQAVAGTTGGVFGHPSGAPLRIAPFAVARPIVATGRTIYGTGQTERQVLELAADLAPGDSGSALVDVDGAVVGIAFAIAKDRPGVAYALSVDEIEAVLAGPLDQLADTGPCLG